MVSVLMSLLSKELSAMPQYDSLEMTQCNLWIFMSYSQNVNKWSQNYFVAVWYRRIHR